MNSSKPDCINSGDKDKLNGCDDCNHREECDVEDEEEGYCPNCSGSGEGMYDGTKCGHCKGSGVAKPEE